MNPKLNIRAFLSIYLSFVILAGIGGLGVLLVFGEIDKAWVLVCAWAISFVMILAGYLANYWAFKRSHKVFMGVLLGGMAIRIGIIGGLVAFFFLRRWQYLIWFLIFMAAYYFIFQVVEIVAINRQLKKQVDVRT